MTISICQVPPISSIPETLWKAAAGRECSFQILLTTHNAVKTAERATWIHGSRRQKGSLKPETLLERDVQGAVHQGDQEQETVAGPELQLHS